MSTTKALITAIASAFILLIPASLQSHAQTMQLVWEEHFNTNAIDTLSWSKINRGNADWKRHMSHADSLYSLRNGHLVLRGVNNHHLQADTARYLTGGVCTKGKRTITQGRVEVRARFDSAQGAWPAIWMLPDNGIQWPYGGEIDIMEHLNHDEFVYQTIHTHYTYDLKLNQNPRHSGTAQIKRDEFNTYAVDILSDSIVFYVNDQRTHVYPRIHTQEAADLKQWPFGTPFYLLVDMQIEGGWVGRANPEQLPVEMEIDWVKFYTLAPSEKR